MASTPSWSACAGAAEAFLERAGVAEANRRFEYVFLGRYEYQSWEIEVPFELADGRRSRSDAT